MNPQNTYHKIRKLVSSLLGVPTRRVAEFVAEYEENGYMTSSGSKTKDRKDIFDKLGQHQLDLVNEAVSKLNICLLALGFQLYFRFMAISSK